ncbi:MAG: ATP-binding protein [Sulfitobacter sp.]
MSEPNPFESGAAFGVHMSEGARNVREMLAEVMRNLEPWGFDVEESSTIQLVLAEVLNNIVEHAYPASEPAGPIDIRCRQHTDGLHFHVADQGMAMPDGQTPLGVPQSLEVDMMDMPEGGFGWFLIKDLAKDVRYNRVGSENQLELRIALSGMSENN